MSSSVAAEFAADSRESFLSAHAADLYDELTEGCTRPLRLEELVSAAAVAVPGLVPTDDEMDAERGRALADKLGVERAQGLLISEILAVPRSGRHLVESLLRPTSLALERLDEFRANGSSDRASI